MEISDRRVKIAVQKSGRLTDKSLDLLERCGLKFTKSKDQLFCYGKNMPIDLLLVRDDDIPGLVSDDVCDLGIVGLNWSKIQWLVAALSVGLGFGDLVVGVLRQHGDAVRPGRIETEWPPIDRLLVG